jgi:phosphoglycolate phosphatase
MTLRAILFDFDFTLADSTAGAVECVNHALVACGYPAAEREAIKRSVAYPLPEVLARLTGIDHDPQAAAAFSQVFIARADEVMAPLTSLYPQAIETVGTLRQRGYQTGIVSTKFRYRIQAILANHGAADLFDVIVGGEDVQRHKPDAEPLLKALARLGVARTDALYIGDHPVDAQAAQAASIGFLAILSGVAKEDEFAGLPRRGMLSELAQLPRWLNLYRAFDKFDRQGKSP